MPLAPEHLHRLKVYKYRNQRQWNCSVLFCKLVTRHPIDLMGKMILCPKCSNSFTFEQEDVKQQEQVLCPVCLGTNEARIKETLVLNEVVMLKTVEVLSDAVVAVKSIPVNLEQIEKIVTADLLKEMRDIRSVFVMEEPESKSLILGAPAKTKDDSNHKD